MMAELALTSESKPPGGKGFNLCRERDRSTENSPTFNNNNNNNLETVLESTVVVSLAPSTNPSTSPTIQENLYKFPGQLQKSPSPVPQSSPANSQGNNSTTFEISGRRSRGEGESRGRDQTCASSPVSLQGVRSRSTSSFVDEKTLTKDQELQQQQLLQQHQQRMEEMDFARSVVDEDAEMNSDDMVLQEEDEEDFSAEDEVENEVEMRMPGEDEDSDKEEHRITVREALMSRAFHAAAARYGSSGGKYSHTGSGGTTGRTSRSGMISPSSSPGALHHPHHQNQNHHPHHVNTLGAVGSSNPYLKSNGHRSDRHGHHNHRTSFGHHQHPPPPPSHRHHHHHQAQLNDEAFIKAERKSHPSSPVQCDLKPDQAEASLNGIGNALLSLASLGSLAALQQSIPNFMANVAAAAGGTGVLGGHGSGSGHTHNLNNLNLHHPGSTPPTLMNVPLNLTHSNSPVMLNNINNNNNISGSNNNNNNSALSPHHFHPQKHHSSGSSHQKQNNLSPNHLLSNPLISSAIANLANANNSSGVNSLTNQAQGSMPQLILASGQISQGIQGAQLLIPTSQGIISQTVLTIPITQPGSPQQNMLSQQNSTGNNGGQDSSSRGSANNPSHHHQSHQLKGQGHGSISLGHSGRTACHPHGSPRASPDYPGSSGPLPSPLMNLAPHLVSQQIGAHHHHHQHMATIQEKMVLEQNNGGLNGVRNSHGKRERDHMNMANNPGGHTVSSLCPPKSSPCSAGGSSHDHDHDSDKFSDNDDDQMVDGINLDEIKEFAKAFKLRRLSLGLTQTQVGQALSVTEGPAYSQSAICSALAWQLAQSQSQSYPPSIHQQSMFEKLDITPKSAQKIKPVLERWMKEAEERYKNGHQNLNEFVGMEPSKKRKRRTSFTPQALEILNNHFERNTHPSGAEITTLAHQLGYEREVIRIWFCNKRQALKNTVRMMSKGSGSSPM